MVAESKSPRYTKQPMSIRKLTQAKKHVRILAIETSCDETAAAIVGTEDVETATGTQHMRSKVYSSIVASQDQVHAAFGGVIPEIASRKHIELLWDVVDRALQEAAMTLDDLDAIAVTHAPGLMGALLVGLSFAKGLALSFRVPLIGCQHLAGHLAAMDVSDVLQEASMPWPHVGFVVSGGHTILYLGQCPGDYRLLGETCDDAAGEAFDKVAKVLGLGYPGGRMIEEEAAKWPSGQPNDFYASLPQFSTKQDDLSFSFSGLKTAVVQRLNQGKNASQPLDIPQVCFAFQEKAFEALSRPLSRSIDRFRPKAVLFCGGVAANKRLRHGLSALCEEKGVRFYVPPFRLCTDNAAMIGAAAIRKWNAGLVDDLRLAASPQAIHDTQTLLREFFPA